MSKSVILTMAIKVTYSWIIYSCLIFGSGILCDRKLEKRHAVSSGSEDIDDMFYCLNGLRIEWSSVCDNNRDCSDGSDETNEFCARYEYGRNISMDCGRVSKEIKNEHSLEATPWIVDIYATHKSKISQYLGLGSIISPNVVVTVARIFRSSGIRFSQNSKEEYDRYLCKIDIPLQNYNENDHNYIDTKIIYLYDGANYEDLAVIVLETKISFSNGVTPVCIDWNKRYNARLMKYSQNRAYGKISGFKIRDQINHTVCIFEQFFPEIFTDIRTCEKRINPFDFESCIWLKLGQREDDGVDFQSLSVLHSDLYYLTGVGSFKSHLDKNKLGFKAITYQVPWIRGILFKYSTSNLCVLPTVEGVVHSYKGFHSILSPGTLINPNTTVIENCEVGYNKTHPNGFRVCQRYGIWKTDSDKLCLKMCQPLLSDSVDIQCSYNGNYANCSNQSKPYTKAKISCKLTHYFAPNVQEEAAKELHCQSNGMWDKELYRCNIMSNVCVLPTIEGVVFTHEDSNDILSQGTLVNHGVTVNENCTFGYHNVNPNGFRVCQKNGKWKSAFNKLCLKMCPPLLSDSLDIKCSYISKYTNCSNLSIPGTIATPKCKAIYVLPNERKETPLELHCQSNGLWDKELYRCNIISNACVLPTVEGVVFTYEDSNDILSQGTLVNHGVTVNENCTFGYHNVNPNGFRVCQKNGKWKSAFNELCLKMCPPLVSDSLDIKCSYKGNYTDCSNLSIPDTIAIPSCKPTHYFSSNGQEETAKELHCQSHGMWDKELYKCNILNTCVLPKVEGVVYTYEYSNESLSHGTLINHGVTVNENCTFGYHNVYPNSFRVCQINGKWKTAYDKLCLKMCPPQLSDSLDIKCTYNGKKTNCSNLSIPDTIAIPKCKDTYSLPNGKIETPIELHCQSNGLWDKELYICEPDCGRPFIKTQILINNGETANVGTAPWNVAIYKKKSNYEFKCGGSIISRNLVVSAAHCFWEKGMPYTIIIIDDLYKVAVGKYYKNFKIFDNEYPQIINVDRILMQDGYNGFFGHYAVDIAVIVLQNSVFFSNGITPVCMDWNGIYNVSNGDEGKIVGWGKTKEGIESPILLKTGLPYINMTTCRDMYTMGFQSYVTPDKCCAGFSLEHGVYEGDSGAGLCVLHSNCYYFTGFMILKDPEANNSITVFKFSTTFSGFVNCIKYIIKNNIIIL
ncbi:uncharacterized protein LOC132944543 isoform X2 [Metopolophium dirhodum]|uniref:uncharacterized protein LOC132944543 isoform X2 n=1 Tax=Metopolophium dirhodum TaxID=44670 RepID=UPI00299054FE|nr:uncharacterized protein LOC132944543 isoform X2 [Metopolophium dirhodum]